MDRSCGIDDIDTEIAIRFDHGGWTFVIVRNHEDKYYFIDGLCTHENALLSEGLVVNNTIECPKHASIFDVETGEVETPPACENLRNYTTKVE